MNHDDVMTEELAEDFVLHGDVGLAANVVAELRLDHAERGLGVASGGVRLAGAHPGGAPRPPAYQRGCAAHGGGPRSHRRPDRAVRRAWPQAQSWHLCEKGDRQAHTADAGSLLTLT